MSSNIVSSPTESTPEDKNFIKRTITKIKRTISEEEIKKLEDDIKILYSEIESYKNDLSKCQKELEYTNQLLLDKSSKLITEKERNQWLRDNFQNQLRKISDMMKGIYEERDATVEKLTNEIKKKDIQIQKLTGEKSSDEKSSDEKLTAIQKLDNLIEFIQ